MKTTCRKEMTRSIWLATRIALLLGTMVVPSLSFGQDAVPQPANRPRNRNPAEQPLEAFVGISKNIKAVLPTGWSIKREKNVVTICREKPIEWYGTISLPQHKDLADLKAKGFIHSGSYTITLEFLFSADVEGGG